MKHLSIFEEFKIKKTKKIYKHLDKGKGGVDKILCNVGDNIDVLSDVIKSLTKRFGLKSNVKYMNAGSFGMAFIVNDDKIIKLTSSESEAKVAKSLIDKEIPHCVNYYDIVYIKKYEIYAILMDKAEKLSPEEKRIVKLLAGSAIFLNDFNRLKKAIDSRNSFVGRKKISESELKRVYDDFREMYSSLKKNNISITDLHEGNIGYIKNKMVHFDIIGGVKKKDIGRISKFKIK